MRAALLVALVGCNQVFHLHDTQAIDAELPVDAYHLVTAPDGGTACPSLPDFSTWTFTPHALASYSGGVISPTFYSNDRVVFMYQSRFYLTPLDGDPAEIQELTAIAGADLFYPSALANHDLLWYVRAGGVGSGGTFFAVFDGQHWAEHRADLPDADLLEPGAPAFYAGALRMVLLVATTATGPGHLIELQSDDGIGWREVAPPAIDPSWSPFAPSLSGDGCWLLFAAQTTGGPWQLYASGRDATGAFGAPVVITAIAPDVDQAPQAAIDPSGTRLWIAHGDALTEARP